MPLPSATPTLRAVNGGQGINHQLRTGGEVLLTELPQLVLNVDFIEFLSMERVAGIVRAAGPEAAADAYPFLHLLDRAKMQLERRIARPVER